MTSGTVRAALRRYLPTSALAAWHRARLRWERLPGYPAYRQILAGRRGLEVGGPSALFREKLPVYPMLAGLDGVNFAAATMWEGRIAEGGQFEYLPGRVGRQFIAEASDLAGFASGRYGCLLSSNCLEHVANPLRALREWVRVVEPGGVLLLVLPNPASNFDHRRPVTSFEHLLADDRDGMGEDDLTHLPEILALHDLSRDPWAGSREAFERRCHDNLRHRGMHHHVFDAALIGRMARHTGLQVLRQDASATDFFLLARTPA